MPDIRTMKYGSNSIPLRLGLTQDGVKQNLGDCYATIILHDPKQNLRFELDTTIIDMDSDAGDPYAWRVQHEWDVSDPLPIGRYRIEVEIIDSEGRTETWTNDKDWPVLEIIEAQ